MSETDPVKTATTKPEIRGGRNLVLLGIGAVALAIISTSLSLWVYYETGDIYIDRSRPGFLPEPPTTDDSEYTLDPNGSLNDDTIKDYLNHLQDEIDKLDAIEDTFSSTPLTDESLGIPDNV